MKPQNKAYLLAALTILCWSTIGSAIKLTLRFVEFPMMLLIASLTAAIFLFFLLLLKKQLRLLLAQNYRQFFYAALLGLLNPFLYYIILFRAYDLLHAQEAVVLNYTWPIILVLLSIPVLKQKIGIKSLAAILISFTGILIIATEGKLTAFHFTSLPGVTLAVGSAFLWGLFWILNIKDPRDDLIKMFLNFLFGFFYITIFTLISGSFRFPVTNGLMGSIYIGLFEMGITFVIWLKALKLSTTTAKVSNFIFLSPFFSLVMVHFVVGEIIMPSTILGLAFIVSGIVLQRMEG